VGKWAFPAEITNVNAIFYNFAQLNVIAEPLTEIVHSLTIAGAISITFEILLHQVVPIPRIDHVIDFVKESAVTLRAFARSLEMSLTLSAC
jgi:hypothetical protein